MHKMEARFFHSGQASKVIHFSFFGANHSFELNSLYYVIFCEPSLNSWSQPAPERANIVTLCLESVNQATLVHRASSGAQLFCTPEICPANVKKTCAEKESCLLALISANPNPRIGNAIDTRSHTLPEKFKP